MAGSNGVIAKTPFAVTITTVATQIRAANGLRRTLSLRNNGVATVYLGNSSAVTTSTGYPLETGDAVDEDQSGDAWWGIVVGPGSGDIRGVEEQ